MSLPLLLLHANCQGDALRRLLAAHPEFPHRFRVAHVVNHLRRPFPEDLLAQAQVVAHQWLEPHWDDHGSEALRARAPAGCRLFRLPNLFFKGYWPFWTGQAGIDFKDSFLEALLARGLADKEILHLACRADPRQFHDLDAIFSESLRIEREKERRWDVPLCQVVEAECRRRPLFFTINHPGNWLLARVADALLAWLGLPPLDPDAVAALPEPFGDFMQPVHPGVGRWLKLEWLEPDMRFPCYGKPIGYEEYVACYLFCRRNDIDDFTGYLMLRGGATPS